MHARLRCLDCSARVYLCKVATVITGRIKIRTRIDAIADVLDGCCECIVVEIGSSKCCFDGFCSIGFHAHACDADAR